MEKSTLLNLEYYAAYHQDQVLNSLTAKDLETWRPSPEIRNFLKTVVDTLFSNYIISYSCEDFPVFYVQDLKFAIIFPGLDYSDDTYRLIQELDFESQDPGWRLQVITPSPNIHQDIMRSLNCVYVLKTDSIDKYGVPQQKMFGDAGYDLHAIEDVSIEPGTQGAIKTGIYLDMPYHLFATIVLRSSIARKGLLTHQSIIDPGYRGDFEVLLNNLSRDTIEVKMGDRVAQILFCQQVKTSLILADKLSESERDTNGWGSSGR